MYFSATEGETERQRIANETCFSASSYGRRHTLFIALGNTSYNANVSIYLYNLITILSGESALLQMFPIGVLSVKQNKESGICARVRTHPGMWPHADSDASPCCAAAHDSGSVCLARLMSEALTSPFFSCVLKLPKSLTQLNLRNPGIARRMRLIPLIADRKYRHFYPYTHTDCWVLITMECY